MEVVPPPVTGSPPSRLRRWPTRSPRPDRHLAQRFDLLLHCAQQGRGAVLPRLAAGRGKEALRVPAGPHGVETELGVRRDAEEHPECAPVGAIRPVDLSALELGYIIPVNGRSPARVREHEFGHCLGELGLGHAYGKALETELIV
jgi:hypothetical protein